MQGNNNMCGSMQKIHCVTTEGLQVCENGKPQPAGSHKKHKKHNVFSLCVKKHFVPLSQ